MPEMGTKPCGYKEMGYEIVRDDIRIPEVLANLRRSHSIFTAVLVCLELLEPFGQVLPWQTITWISLAHCRELLWKQGALIPCMTSLQCTSLGFFDHFWSLSYMVSYVYWARRRRFFLTFRGSEMANWCQAAKSNAKPKKAPMKLCVPWDVGTCVYPLVI